MRKGGKEKKEKKIKVVVGVHSNSSTNIPIYYFSFLTIQFLHQNHHIELYQLNLSEPPCAPQIKDS